MLKQVGSAVIAYVAIFVMVFVGLAVAWAVFGADRVFHMASYRMTGAWLATTLVVGLVAALAGGYLCSVLGKRSSAVIILAVIIAVMGAVDAAMTLPGDRGLPGVRLGDVGMFEAMQHARPPAWFSIVNPLLGIAGVIAGAKLRRQET